MRSCLEYQDVLAFCSTVFGNLRKTRVQNFASVVFSLILTRQATLSAAARSLGNGCSYKTNRQRFYRFFRFKTITVLEIGAFLIPLVVGRLRKDKLVSIIIDTTTLAFGIQCLTAAVPWRGRALPVAAFLYLHRTIPKSQNKLEYAFFKWVLSHIPAGYKICFVADRGFGRAALFKKLKSWKVDFVVRVKTDVLVSEKEGKQVLLSRRWVKENRTKLLKDLGYRADQVVRINICLSRASGAAEMWYLATSLDSADATRSRYEQRFQIEETFKDAKHQLGLECIKLRKKERVEKLVAALLVAILLLIWLGLKAEGYRALIDETGERAKLSFVSLALLLLANPPPVFRRTCLAAIRAAGRGDQM